ncbi:sensor histidine kinase [candidate division CSSED10-310 bacterium]|uniref:histidine kinase n=1 Tax=candidate division CSSED10-310 bacterium TaxID=2855610 RepID=A0ABV6Z0K6_UNCC1
MREEFISFANHELKTLLTSILGSLSMVVDGYLGEIPSQMKEVLEIAHKNSKLLLRLIEDLTDLERIEAGKLAFDLRAVDIIPLIEQAIEMNRTYGELFGIQFELHNPVQKAIAKVDVERFSQVLNTLLSNAVKFSPFDETVRVTVEQLELYLRINITDMGPGIPDEFHDQIFQKFGPLKSEEFRDRGVGLGLSISKAIIEKFEGDIGYDVESQAGSTFYVRVPLCQENGE